MVTPIISAAELAEHRADALSRMTSTGIIRHRGPAGPPDPNTGHRVTTWERSYAGPLRLDGLSAGTGDQTVASPGGETRKAQRIVHLPHDTRLPREFSVLQVIDGEWAGTFWLLGDPTGADSKTALRLFAAECPKPEDWPEEV